MDALIKIIYQFFIIKQSGLFDENYYLNNYTDIMHSGINPIIHYVKWGWREGRDPSPNFNTSQYLEMNEDVGTANINPLFHYIKFGRKEGRQTQKGKLSASGKELNIRNYKSKSSNHKKRLIIHIGMPKTGSKSLQSFLFANSDELKELGIFYPKHLHHNNIKFFPIFLDNPFDYIHQRKYYSSEELARKKYEEYKNEWIKVFKKNSYQDLIISSELLYISTEEQVSKIYRFIKDYFEDIKILCYIREPKSFLRSYIQQGIKAGVIVENNQENLVTKHINLCNYSNFLNNWLELFINYSVEVVNFDKTYLYEGDILKDFFYRNDYGTLINKFQDTNKDNVSMHADVISFLYYYNQKYPAYKEGKINNQRGLPLNHAYIAKILQRVNDEKETNEIKLSDPLKVKLNNEINFVNNLLRPNTKLPLLKIDGTKSNYFEIKNIGIDVFTDIANECFKEIELLLKETKNNN